MTLRFRKPADLIAWLIASACVILTIVYVWLHIARPSDGARLPTEGAVWESSGVVVEPLEADPQGLSSGDLVTGVDGRSLESWIKDLFRLPALGASTKFGEVIPYQVIRGGQSLEVRVVQARFRFDEIFRSYWGAILFIFVSQVIAVFVYLRKPGDPSARLLFIWAFLGCNVYAWSIGLIVSDITNKTGFWLYTGLAIICYLLFWLVMVHFALVLPNRHPWIVRRPVLLPLFYLVSIGIYLGLLAIAWLRSESLMGWIGSWNLAINPIILICILSMLIIVTWNYRTTHDATTREQIRWALYGATLAGIGSLALWVIPSLLVDRPLISPNVLGLVALCFPVCLAIAILRHRLFDIDRVINRTLVYGLLSLALAVIFYSGVTLLQSLFQSFSGQQSSLSIVLSTLAIAVLANPLRRWVQDFIDRRFYRKKYNAEQALERFAAVARDETDLERLSAELLAVVQETMQPESVSLWLKPQRRKR